MPIMRQPIQIRDTRNMTTVRSQRSGLGDVLSQQSQYYFQRSRQYGQMFIAEGEEFARKLAREAVFSEDENGVPQMPERETKFMGSVVAKTYNAAMAEQMTYRLQTAIRKQIKEAEIANQGDVEGYAKEAVKRTSKMLENLPQEFHGAFQRIRDTEFGEAGFKVGREEAALDLIDQRISYSNHLNSLEPRIRGDFLQGLEELGEAQLGSTIEFIIKQPRTVIGPDQKGKDIKRLLYIAGRSRFFRDFDVENMSSTQLKVLRQKLQLSNFRDEIEFSKYFKGFDTTVAIAQQKMFEQTGYKENINLAFETDADGNFLYDEQMGEWFASELSALVETARLREVAQENMLNAEARWNSIKNGRIRNLTKEDGLVYDSKLASMLNIHGVTTLSPAMWETGEFNEEQLNGMMVQIKQAGLLPPSLEGAFRSAAVTQDQDKFKNLYDIYVRLKDMHNMSGNTVDLASIMPDDSEVIFGFADTLLGKGQLGSFGMEQFWGTEEKSGLFKRWQDQEFTDRNWEDKENQLKYYIKKEAILGGIFHNPLVPKKEDFDNLTGEAFDAAIKGILADEMGLDGRVSSKEMGEAQEFFYQIFRLQLAGGDKKPVENSIELTRQAMNGRYKPSKYVSGGLEDGYRTQNAIEHVFPEEPTDNLIDAFGDFWKKSVVANWREMRESSVPLLGLYRGDTREYSEPDYAAAWARSTLIDKIINAHIHDAMEAKSDDEKFFYQLPFEETRDADGKVIAYGKKREGMYEAGIHYVVEEVYGGGSKPRYRILMRGRGMTEGIFETVSGLENVDLHADYQMYRGQMNRMNQAMAYARAEKVVFDHLYDGNWLKEKLAKSGYTVAKYINDFGWNPINRRFFGTGKDQATVAQMRELIDVVANKLIENQGID